MLKPRTWNTTTQAVALETRSRPTALRRAILPLLVLLLCGWLPLNASASLIEFHLSEVNNGGVFEYTLAGGSLNGIGMGVDSVVGTDTPANPDVVLPCTDCSLNFTTGDLISYDAANLHWIFDGGESSSITIDGKVPSIGITTSQTLLSATFSAPVQVFQIFNGYTIMFANHESSLDNTIAAYYQVDPTPFEDNGGINLAAVVPTVASNGTFSTSTILSGDVVLELAAIPEPGTALLLAIGLAGLATQTSRQQRIRQ